MTFNILCSRSKLQYKVNIEKQILETGCGYTTDKQLLFADSEVKLVSKSTCLFSFPKCINIVITLILLKLVFLWRKRNPDNSYQLHDQLPAEELTATKSV